MSGCRPQRSRRRMTFFFYPSTPSTNRHWLLSGDMRSVVIMARAVCEHCKREYLIADDVPMTEKKRPRSVSHRKSSCQRRTQLDGIGIKVASLEKLRAYRRGFSLALYAPPTRAKPILVVQIPHWRALNSEIISAREVGARNRGCAGNSWLGYCPHSERLFATQIEKALTIMRYITKPFSAFSPLPISPDLLL